MDGTESLARLTAASHAALGGTNPEDAWRAWGLTLPDAITFAVTWADELAEKSTELGEDPTADEFRYRLVVGALAVGIQFGLDVRKQCAGMGGT